MKSTRLKAYHAREHQPNCKHIVYYTREHQPNSNNPQTTLNMLIRRAKPDESGRIVPFILLAMEDIVYQFIGESSSGKAAEFLVSLINEENNQYSWQNCWVAESEGAIIAAAIVYDGGRLHELRAPVARKIKEMFNRGFNPEDETQAGEYYIDSVGVDGSQQGRGVGTKLFSFLIDEYVRKKKQPLGLLVDKDNPAAKKLYLKLGFQVVGEKTLTNKRMEHLQLRP